MATSARVGNLLGASQPRAARRALCSALLLVAAWLPLPAVALLSLASDWGRLFTSSEEVVGLLRMLTPILVVRPHNKAKSPRITSITAIHISRITIMYKASVAHRSFHHSHPLRGLRATICMGVGLMCKPIRLNYPSATLPRETTGNQYF